MAGSRSAAAISAAEPITEKTTPGIEPKPSVSPAPAVPEEPTA